MGRCPCISNLVFGCEWAFELITLCDFVSAVDSDLSDKLLVTFLYCYLDFIVYVSQEIEVLAPDETFSFDGVPDSQEPSFA
jgi:hypothetical protein